MENITVGNIAAVIGSLVAIISGVAYLKKNLKDWVSSAVKDDIQSLHGEISDVKNQLVQIEDARLQDNAESSRYRILRFYDELLHGQRHTKEHFDQVLDCVDEYQRYCGSHPTYKNSKCVQAIKGIQRINEKCAEENSYL